MQAVVASAHGDADVLELRDVATPDPGPGEVRVRVAAAGLNFADVEKRRGNYPDGPDPPFVAGMEAAGRVDAVGPGVDRAVGDPVVCLGDGAFAEYVVVDAYRTFDAPDVPLVEAAGVPVQWLTARNCLFEWGDLSPGETVLVLAAAGGVGSAAVQLASHAGATVLGAASGEKTAFVSDLGATAVDYEATDLASAVAESTDGRGVDLVLDGVGGGAFRGAVDALDDCGRVVTYGMASGRPGSVATPRLFFRNRSVVGYHLEHGLAHDRERVLTGWGPLTEALESGAASVRVDRRFPLPEARAAYERLESRASRGKLLLTVDP